MKRLLLISTCLFFFFSCTNEGDKLVGEWEIKRDKKSPYYTRNTIEFRENGSMKWNSGKNSQYWVFKDSILVIDNNDGSGRVLLFDVTGDKLTIKPHKFSSYHKYTKPVTYTKRK